MAGRTPVQEPTRMVRPPAHPVAQLQGPFEESMLESIHDADTDVPSDSVARRTLLLDAPTYERVIAGRWKQKPGEKYHPLWKLIAQLSFGIHLLAQGMAKSEDEVMRILQVHVDDIDGFLERSTEDFDLAQTDVQERLRCLKLPLAHPEVFDRMLEDRAFRASILDGNQKIEHIVNRTSEAMRDSLKDVQKGFDATNTLEKYLVNLETMWIRLKPEHEAVYVAMLGNVEGWRRAFLELHLQGNKLAGGLKKLTELVQEMERRAAEVSRKTITSMQFQGYYPRQVRGSVASTVIKPLPQAPESRYSVRPPNVGRVSKLSVPQNEIAVPTRDTRQSGQPSLHKSSPRSRASGGSTNTAASAQLASLSESSPPQSRLGQVSAIPPRIVHQHTREVSQPVELPADVPEEVLHQAPVSRNSRLSMLLSPRSRDYLREGAPGDRSSRALTDQIKFPSPLSFGQTPEAALSQEISPATPQTAASEAKVDYFTGAPTPALQTALSAPNVQDADREQEYSADVPPSQLLSRPTSAGHGLREHPAFNSHPPELPMATPPRDPLPKSVSKLSHPSLSRTQSHGSSVGEPGPSLFNVDMHSAKGSIGASTILSISDAGPTPDQIDPLLRHGDKEPAVSVSQLPTPEVTTTLRVFVAELEAAPVPRTAPTMVELEAAPQHHFRLPPRPSADPKPEGNVRDANLHELQAAPQQHFILPPRSFAMPKSGGNIQNQRVPQATQPDLRSGSPVAMNVTTGDVDVDPKTTATTGAKSHVARLPSLSNNASSETRQNPQRSSLRNPLLQSEATASIITKISCTPQHSPIHERTPSFASTSSAQIIMSSGNQSKFAPPVQAPPPPGPGGRSMVMRDFATAGLYEGERSKPKRASHSSKSSWKEFFNGGQNVPQSEVTAMYAITNGNNKKEQRTSDMITSAGKDVLWFKGNQRTSAGVTTA